jgi:hypothetical protein
MDIAAIFFVECKSACVINATFYSEVFLPLDC